MPILVIGGPTGSGKSKLALEYAKFWLDQNPGKQAQIFCADSITIYRGFDIGSAKPSKDEQAMLKHHLLDIREANEEFTAADFVEFCDPLLQKNEERGFLSLLVGGTGFYLRALLQGMTAQSEEESQISERLKRDLEARAVAEGIEPLYKEMLALDPALKEKIHQNDHYRVIRALQAMHATGKLWSELNAMAKAAPPKYPHAKFVCLNISKEQLSAQIQLRSAKMIQDGLLLEVQRLLQKYSPTCKPLQSVGYKECLEYLQVLPCDAPPSNELELVGRIAQNTLRLAKRQLTWFRSERGITWILPENGEFLTHLKSILLD